jgi:hypothetical protein
MRGLIGPVWGNRALVATVGVQFFSSDRDGFPVPVVHYFDLNGPLGQVLSPAPRAGRKLFPIQSAPFEDFARMSIVIGGFADTRLERQKVPRITVRNVEARFFRDLDAADAGGGLPFIDGVPPRPLP